MGEALGEAAFVSAHRGLDYSDRESEVDNRCGRIPLGEPIIN